LEIGLSKILFLIIKNSMQRNFILSLKKKGKDRIPKEIGFAYIKATNAERLITYIFFWFQVLVRINWFMQLFKN